MTHGCVHVVVHWVPTVDHQAIHKLHGFGPLTSEFAGHNDLTALGPALHDEAEDTVAGSAGRGQPSHEPTLPDPQGSLEEFYHNSNLSFMCQECSSPSLLRQMPLDHSLVTGGCC